ncbi:hypothetical protein NA57DRAFT_45430 [Rhizodiscina lignyota]|uniref:RRM domain-containing protein n=1 Tax=Rhizodiscina lignyota TaxID=1504668 RepID=A0A9P4I4N7_9PEZI|nr:hypothetical protein NA57DRAFT_45430 [Rhizodiscina lignyota]
MSSSKLDQSLDTIMGESRQFVRRNNRRVRGGAKAIATPVGGVHKPTRAAKAAEKVMAPTGGPRSGEGKIQVSNLPMDVEENQIKDYFHSTIGPVKKVLLTYGPNGKSRGVATVIFHKHDSAVKAAKDLDGLKVDKRPMKVELLVAAKEVPNPVPARSLGDRIE